MPQTTTIDGAGCSPPRSGINKQSINSKKQSTLVPATKNMIALALHLPIRGVMLKRFRNSIRPSSSIRRIPMPTTIWDGPLSIRGAITKRYRYSRRPPKLIPNTPMLTTTGVGHLPMRGAMTKQLRNSKKPLISTVLITVIMFMPTTITPQPIWSRASIARAMRSGRKRATLTSR